MTIIYQGDQQTFRRKKAKEFNKQNMALMPMYSK